MKRKQGISLIVLVITIIVMIILAAAVVITLNNSGIINKANDAVKKTDKKQVEYIATLAWSEAYTDGNRGEDLKEVVLDKLKDYTDQYDIIVSDKGVEVKDKEASDDTTSGDTEDGVEPGEGGTSFSQAAITYTWAELNDMAMENLTPEQYKSQYGLEVGMIKDEKFVLVDMDGNDYDGFVFMYDMGIDKNLDDYNSNTGAYPSFPTAEFIKDSFVELPYEIRRIAKTIVAKVNESTASIDTVYNYSCQLVLPSAREISNTVSTWEPDTIPLDREGSTFDFFVLYGAEARRAICSNNHWWTRSCSYDIYSVYSVQPDGGVGASYPTGVYALHPFFVIGRTPDPEIPSTTVNDYTWEELKTIGAMNLTADQYKYEYGIQVGQIKDEKYWLVDVSNNYDGFVFMFDSGVDSAYSTVGKNYGGYSGTYYIANFNNVINTLETDLQSAIKQVTINHNGGLGDWATEYTYSCKVFAPAVREISKDHGNYYTYASALTREGQTFEWFLVDDYTDEYAKRAAICGSTGWWTRSTYTQSNRTDSFCSVQADGGIGASLTSGTNRLVMCFVIG